MLLATLIATPTLVQPAFALDGGSDIGVMTYNLYVGADVTRIVKALPQDVPARVAQTWAIVQATDFPTRAKAVADEIVAKKPALVGLQEAALWRIQSPGDFFTANTPANTVAYDFLEILRNELHARGVDYNVVAISTGADIELPSSSGDDIRLTDRDVLLARSDLSTSGIGLSNAKAGHFASNLVVPIARRLVTIRRGWVQVDVSAQGKTFRFVTTHLDPTSQTIQTAQAIELLTGPGATTKPLVFVGDFNSDANKNGATYRILRSAGFSDAWLKAGAGPGLTCCQAENLLNNTSLLNKRIDLILFRKSFATGFNVADIEVVGDEQADRIQSTAGLLWPSDHAGVVSTLDFPVLR